MKQPRESDLAPGDGRSRTLDLSHVTFEEVGSREEPLFDECYRVLWDEFGHRGEMEAADVLQRRFETRTLSTDGAAYWYSMVAIRVSGALAAIRDHTSIVLDLRTSCVVHLSHAWVSPAFRRTGIAGWLRAVPLATARDHLERCGLPESLPIDLVAEMEPPENNDPSRLTRLVAYEKAGYRKVDPLAVKYFQPDFRPPSEIDASGGPKPVLLNLIVRRVGRESEDIVSGGQVRRWIEALYDMYGREFRASDMEELRKNLEALPRGGAAVRLLLPTEGVVAWEP